MAIARKPDTLIIAGVSVPCEINPMGANSFFAPVGIELNNPHELFCDLTYAYLFGRENINDEVGRATINGEAVTFRVRSRRVFADGLPADHCEALLEQTEFD